MIFCSVLHTLHDFNASKYVFEQSALMYDMSVSGSVAVDVQSTQLKTKRKISQVVSWQSPDRLSGSFTAKGETQQFFVDRFRSITYRADLKQYVQNSKDEKITLRDAALAVEPRLEPLSLSFTQIGEMAKFYEVFAKLPGWKIDVKNGLVLMNTKVEANKYQIHFRANDFSLAYLSMEAGNLKQEWTVRPGPGLKFFEAPEGVFKVLAFSKPLAEPKYASREAKALVTKMFKAYDRPEWLAFTIRDRDQTTKVLLKGKQMRQTDRQADFAFNGSKAAVLDKAGNTFYEGKVGSRELREAVTETGTRFDPMVSKLVEGTNYFRELLSHGAVIKIAMKTKDRQGQAVTMLEAKMPTDTMSLAVRDSDGKVLSMMSSLKGMGEKVATQRVFEYLPRSAVDSASAFEVVPPKGAKRKGMSEIVAQN